MKKKTKQSIGIIAVALILYASGIYYGITWMGIPAVIIMFLAWAWATGKLTIKRDSDYNVDGLEGVNRFEVIDETGRLMVEYLADDVKLTGQLQDENKTLKIFLKKKIESKEGSHL